LGILKYVNTNFNIIRQAENKGIQYKRVKTFKSEVKAKMYLSEINKNCKSKRHRSFIESVKIGPGLGYIYRICVPKGMEVKNL